MQAIPSHNDPVPTIPVVKPLDKTANPQMMQQYWDCILHELRSNMSGVSVASELAVKGDRPELLRAIHAGAKDTLRILDDMTTTVAVNTDRLNVSCNLSTFPLISWLRKTLLAYDALHQPKDKRIVLGPSRNVINASITADHIKLKQVVDNVLSNAVKYSTAELIEVQVEPAPPDDINITITNKGKTIPKEAIEHLFTPYYRLDNGSAGTGLGLYIAGIYMEAMNGGMIVFSEEEETTFGIIIPGSNPIETKPYEY